MSTPLHPPLAMIERELFGQEPDGDPGDAAAVAPTRPDAAAAPALPAHLQALIERKALAAATYGARPLAVGQIRCLSSVPAPDGPPRRLGRTCAVLLGRWVAGHRWAGWMVTQEADYASDRDLVLQDDDGIIAPEAAMVQTWNAVEVDLRGDEALLGQLSAHGLGAVLKLADGCRANDQFVAPRPGRIGAWDIDDDTTVVTGTPLGLEDDPRLGYRRLYLDLATEFATAGAAANSARPPERPAAVGWAERLRDVFVRPAWTFGALALVVGQTAWLVTGPYRDGDTPQYRGVTAPAQADACRTRIRVMFKLDTSYADLVLALRRVDATLVSGPSETGEIWLLPPPDQNPQEVAAMLRQHHLVEQADVILPESHACRH